MPSCVLVACSFIVAHVVSAAAIRFAAKSWKYSFLIRYLRYNPENS
ncbi:MAG TPA: hypothetical protein DEB17_07130 [Chlorobaculum sp.]|uniref:Uncharacterized protein n=1 Tax=Chlorobaculum tepidum (strain ATCC 49652 / DSM 12025 / NBRC 103806 / TLS) TaxID=194439 RepID=Q8KFQ1_CHLTE|nr:hypothetical protein CT0271 [Chlorobaculum tepidum TLS]HBU23745.1 hypothetical protein [Chlorobaculum sp.]